MAEKIICEVCGAEIDIKTGSARIKKGTNAALIRDLKEKRKDDQAEIKRMSKELYGNHGKPDKKESKREIPREDDEDSFGTII